MEKTGCQRHSLRQARAANRESGNVFAESALVVVPFMALLLGIIDFGMAIFLRSTFQSAVAAGTRYAVTYQLMDGYCMDDSIRLVTQANALGFLGRTDAPNSNITVNYYAVGALSTALTGAANQPGNIVEVTLTNYQWQWLTNLSGTFTPRSSTPLALVVYSSDRLGGLPPGVSAPCR